MISGSNWLYLNRELTHVVDACREIAKHLSLPPVKLHCSMLAEDAIKAAVKDYNAKRAKATADGGATSGEKVTAA